MTIKVLTVNKYLIIALKSKWPQTTLSFQHEGRRVGEKKIFKLRVEQVMLKREAVRVNEWLMFKREADLNVTDLMIIYYIPT